MLSMVLARGYQNVTAPVCTRLKVAVTAGLFVLAGLTASFGYAADKTDVNNRATDLSGTPSMALRAEPCNTCHNKLGRNSAHGYVPRIAGKPRQYLFNQLLAFRDGSRHYAPMADLLRHLTDHYLMALADYFARQPVRWQASNPTAASASKDALTIIRRGLVGGGQNGRDIKACANCHGADLMGDGIAVPPLLGLPADYVAAQLGAWRNGTRKAAAPDCMVEVAHSLKPVQVGAISNWLASQPVPEHGNGPSTDKSAIEQCGSFGYANGPAPASDKPAALTGDTDAVGARGSYLAKIANCVGCHTVPGGPPLGGGRAVQTPYGTIYSSNLTPHPRDGIGAWSAVQFRRALREGISRDGRLLYPAFPYPHYAALKSDDVTALFNWLGTQPAVASPNRTHKLRFPYNTSAALWSWRQLYFEAKDYTPDQSRSETWNRGAYLVRTVGHCGACHTQRNAFGAVVSRTRYDGAPMPSGRWYSPSLHDPLQGGLQGQSIDEIVQLLRTGRSPGRTLSGPMADVVYHSTQHLTDADLTAMATYLNRLPATNQGVAASPASTARTRSGQTTASVGAQLYKRLCTDCHGSDGRGETSPSGIHRFIALAGNRTVLSDDPTNLISIVLHGGYQPVTQSQPWPFGMPPYLLALNDQELAELISFVRRAFGNGAPAVSADQVQRLR